MPSGARGELARKAILVVAPGRSEEARCSVRCGATRPNAGGVRDEAVNGGMDVNDGIQSALGECLPPSIAANASSCCALCARTLGCVGWLDRTGLRPSMPQDEATACCLRSTPPHRWDPALRRQVCYGELLTPPCQHNCSFPRPRPQSLSWIGGTQPRRRRGARTPPPAMGARIGHPPRRSSLSLLPHPHTASPPRRLALRRRPSCEGGREELSVGWRRAGDARAPPATRRARLRPAAAVHRHLLGGRRTHDRRPGHLAERLALASTTSDGGGGDGGAGGSPPLRGARLNARPLPRAWDACRADESRRGSQGPCWRVATASDAPRARPHRPPADRYAPPISRHTRNSAPALLYILGASLPMGVPTAPAAPSTAPAPLPRVSHHTAPSHGATTAHTAAVHMMPRPGQPSCGRAATGQFAKWATCVDLVRGRERAAVLDERRRTAANGAAASGASVWYDFLFRGRPDVLMHVPVDLASLASQTHPSTVITANDAFTLVHRSRWHALTALRPGLLRCDPRCSGRGAPVLRRLVTEYNEYCLMIAAWAALGLPHLEASHPVEPEWLVRRTVDIIGGDASRAAYDYRDESWLSPLYYRVGWSVSAAPPSPRGTECHRKHAANWAE